MELYGPEWVAMILRALSRIGVGLAFNDPAAGGGLETDPGVAATVGARTDALSTGFDVVVQDDRDPSLQLAFNSVTGAHRCCVAGRVYTGMGVVAADADGGAIAMTEVGADRFVGVGVSRRLGLGSGVVYDGWLPGSDELQLIATITVANLDAAGRSCAC